MINNHHAVASLAALALIGTTLGVATPAFASPKFTKVVTTTMLRARLPWRVSPYRHH